MVNIHFLKTIRFYSFSTHLYRNLHPWKSRSELVQHLYENIVYNQAGLVAINKPYGIAINKMKEGNESGQKVMQTAVLPLNGNCQYTIEDCLPQLSEMLDEKELYILKSTERYSSGIVLLSSNKKTSDNVSKAFRRGQPKHASHLVYWAVTKGCPSTPSLKERISIKLDCSSAEEKQPVIIKNFSKVQIRKKLVKPVSVDYRTLHSNVQLPCSLVEIAVSSAKWSFVKVYLTTRACYVLGDVSYSSRVKEILGKAITVNPTDVRSYESQPLSPRLCGTLNIPRNSNNSAVPVMLHLHSVVLTGYNKGDDLIIVAPVPPHFSWTCEKLDLLKGEAETNNLLQISCK